MNARWKHVVLMLTSSMKNHAGQYRHQGVFHRQPTSPLRRDPFWANQLRAGDRKRPGWTGRKIPARDPLHSLLRNKERGKIPNHPDSPESLGSAIVFINLDRAHRGCQKPLSQNQHLVGAGTRLRAIGWIVVGKPAPIIKQLVFVQPCQYPCPPQTEQCPHDPGTGSANRTGPAGTAG